MADILDEYGITVEAKKPDILDENEIEAPAPFINTPAETFGGTEKMFIESTGETVDAPAGSGKFFNDIVKDDTFDGDPAGAFEEAGAGFEKQAANIGWMALSYGLVSPEKIAPYIAERSQALAVAQKKQPEYMDRFNKRWEEAKGFGESVAVALFHPKAAGRMVITQAPNSLFPLVAGTAGGIVGSIGGPAGARVGYAAGTFAGSSISEIGSTIDQLMMEAGVDPTNAAQIIEAHKNTELMDGIKSQAEKKGFTTATVDAMFTVIGGKMTSKVMKGAEKAVAKKTANTIASKIASKAILAGAVAADVTIDAIGETISEAAGQQAGFGKVDWKDALLEGLTSVGQSVGQTAIGVGVRSVKPRGKTEATPAETAQEVALTPKETATYEIAPTPAVEAKEVSFVNSQKEKFEGLSGIKEIADGIEFNPNKSFRDNLTSIPDDVFSDYEFDIYDAAEEYGDSVEIAVKSILNENGLDFYSTDASKQSESRYWEISKTNADDTAKDFSVVKVRFSDHDDRHQGSDVHAWWGENPNKIAEKIFNKAKVLIKHDVSTSETVSEPKVQAEEAAATAVQVETEAQVPDFSPGAMQFLNDVSAGKSVDVASLSPSDQKIVVDIIGSEVENQLNVLSAQSGSNFLPTPKRPETLSEFIRSKGGLSLVGETQRFTKKESPNLRGVAKKNGILSLDEAREMAAEAGFIGREGEAEIEDLLYALEAEARGEDIVRASDMDAALKRSSIIEYNAQLAEQNQLILENSKEIRTLKTALLRGASAARKDVKSVQGSIITALQNTGLRAEDKAKFIRTIKNIQTHEQLEKAIPKIEKRVNDLVDAESKRRIRDAIRKAISNAKASDKVAVESLADIRELEDRLKANGILSGAPSDPSFMDGAERSPTMQEVSVREFKDALAEALMLTKQGRARQFLKEEMKAQRMRRDLEDLAVSTKKLESMKTKRGPIGEAVTKSQIIRKFYVSAMNKAQELGLNKNPMDVFFDALDGAKNYMGANFRIFKASVDKKFGRYLNRSRTIKDRIIELNKTLKLEKGNLERIGVWAALQQEGGYDHLIGSGLTDKDIKSIRERFENGGIDEESRRELRMYTAMRDELDALQEPLAGVMAEVYNKDFKKVKNYFSFMTDFEAMGSVEIQNRFGDDAFIIGKEKKPFNKKDVSKGFTKERQGGRTAIKLDAMEVFLKHVDNASYLIEMGQTVKELGELASSQEYRELAGDIGQEIVVDWLNLIARKGNISGPATIWDTLRKNVGAAMLGFKLSSTFIQGTALLDGASLVGGDWVFGHGVKDVCSADWRKFIIENMPEVRERIGDDAAFRELEGNAIFSKARDAGMWALKKIDALAASAVAIGAYRKYLAENGQAVDMSNPSPEAIEYAQLMVRRTQSSSFFKDSPPIISQGKLTGLPAIDKLITQFQSFVINRWSLIEHDMIRAGFRGGRTKQAANIFVWLALAGVSEYFIRHWTKEMIAAMTGAEPPEEDDGAGEIVIKQAISNVPFASSFINSAQYGSIPVPAIDMVGDIFSSLSYAGKSKSASKKAKHYTNAAITAAGAVLGVPGTQQAKDIVNKVAGAGEEKKTASNSLASQ